MDEQSNGVRLEAQSVQGYWAANTAAGMITLTAVAGLVVLRHIFKGNLGG